LLKHDYILEWIKRYVQWLAQILGFIRAQDFEAAMQRVDLALRTLLGVGPDSVTTLTEGEILARLTLEDPPPLVREKCVIVAALLQQLGEVCAAQQREAASHDCYLKALQIVLGLRLRPEESLLPEFAPRVTDLARRLRGAAVPPRTHAALLIYYEQERQFDQAEDALFALLETAPQAADSVAIGLGFYERLRVLSDEVLAQGGLPRAEVEAGLAELRARAQGFNPP